MAGFKQPDSNQPSQTRTPKERISRGSRKFTGRKEIGAGPRVILTSPLSSSTNPGNFESTKKGIRKKPS